MEPTNEQRIYFMGRALWTMVLRGNPTERDKALYERMRDPQPGDLVVELSTGHRARQDTWHAGQVVGFLDKIEGASYYERRYHVQPYAGGPVLSWDNAEFVAIPNGVTVSEFIEGGP